MAAQFILTRSVNFLRALDDLVEIAPHLIEVLDDDFAFFGFGLDCGRRLIDPRRDGLDLFLNLLDQILNFLALFAEVSGQGAHFVSNYGKAFAMLTGAGGFDSSI